MEFQSNVFPNEQAIPTSNDTSIYFNYKQPNYSLTSNVESRFSPTTNSSVDSLPINELIDFHKKRVRKEMMYLYIISGIMFLIGIILLIISFVLPKCTPAISDCSSLNIVLLAFGSSMIGSGIIFALVGVCVSFCCMKKQFNDLNFTENGQQPCIWRLDGEQWIRYLNYIHGPNREWREVAPLSSFCCRRSSYDRLMNRQYGHIVLHDNGLIIDELYCISFRQYTLQGVQLLYINQHPQIIGLRIHTYLQAGKNSHNCYFDVFAPSSVSLEQLQTIAQSYNRGIPGLDGSDAAMVELHLTESVLHEPR